MIDPAEPPHEERSRRGPARWLPVFAALLLALSAAVTATGQEESAADDASEEQEKSPWVRAIEVGGGYGYYPDSEDWANGQFVRLSWSRPQAIDIRADAGRQERFGATTSGAGLSLSRHFKNKTSVTLGAGWSTGELAPEVGVGLAVSRPLAKIGWTLGFAHEEWKSGASTDKLSLGAQRWFSHWIVAAGVKYDVGYPGGTTSTSGSVGVTYYQWKKLYVGLGYDFGDVSYTLIGPENALVDYRARGVKLGFSRWFQERQGINLRLDRGSPPEAMGLTVSWFREW